MTIEDNSSNRIIKRRILKPRTPTSLEDQRPKMKLRELTPQENENSEHVMQTKKDKDSENMKRTNFTDEYKRLMQSLTNQSVSMNTKEAYSIEEPHLQTSAEAEIKTSTTDNSGDLDKNSTSGTRFFKFPRNKVHQGGNCRLLHWKNPGQYEQLQVNGSVAQFVSYAGWHLNGAKIWMGTSASNASELTGHNPATGVNGLIANAIKDLVEMTVTAKSCSPTKLDQEGRQLQFGVIAVLGGQDHKAILREAKSIHNNKAFANAFRAAGAPNASLRAALYNEMGELFAFEVNLGNPEVFGKGRHLLFLHPANDIGGGKSDESLMDGRLSFQSASLGRQFEWWKSALEYGDGKIGSLESTLGGTARLGRYALLSARIPRTLFSSDATEIINVDKADYIKENLQSQAQEYRASYATTLLRAVWGNVGKRLKGIPVTIVNRHDTTMRNIHRQRSTIAILRHLFLGSPKLDLLRGDISDERIAKQREEAITDNEYFTMYDDTNPEKYGPWEQHRRIRMSTSYPIHTGKLLQMSRGENSQAVIDDAETIISDIRGLATSDENALPAGGFIIVDALIPENLISGESGIAKETVNRAIELFAKGLEKHGSEKILINLYNIPSEFSRNNGDVVLQITEDQPGTNVLMVSTEEIDTHGKRVILQNPSLPSITDTTCSSVYAFGRLLGRMVTAHLQSGYHHCIEDGELIRAFHKCYFGGRFGHRPNRLPGGQNRIRNKKEN